MHARKILAIAPVLIALVALGLLAGPARWEVAHTYQHLIAPFDDALPHITIHVALPLLDLPNDSATSLPVRVFVWGWLWLVPIVLVAGIWRAPSAAAVSDWLLLGGFLYGAVAGVIGTVLLIALMMPFLLL